MGVSGVLPGVPRAEATGFSELAGGLRADDPVGQSPWQSRGP